MQQQQTTMDGDDDHKTDWRGLVGAATRRTTITGSPVEKLAVDELLGLFFSAEKLASVHMTDKDMSILARYSWAISVPLASTPKTVVLQALKSPSLRRQYHTRMAGEYKLLMVEATLVRSAKLVTNCNPQ